MATEVEWTDRAVANLNHIHDFIAQDSDIYNPKHAPEKVNIIAGMSGRMDLVRHVKPEWVI